VPANHGLGANDMERVSPLCPLVGEPHPEETLEAPELRSLRPAKPDELLPQRQVLEREVSAGFERRTQRAQQRLRGHCLPGSHAAGSSSSLGDRILAKDRHRRTLTRTHYCPVRDQLSAPSVLLNTPLSVPA